MTIKPVSSLFLTHHRRLILIGGVLIVLILTSALIFPLQTTQLTTPKTNIPQPPQPTSLTQETQLIINTSLPTIPSKLTIYTTTPSTSPEKIAGQIATNLNLIPHPEVQTMWRSLDQNTTLSYDSIAQQIRYSHPQPETTPPIQPNAVEVALEFLNTIFSTPNPSPQINQTLYFAGYPELSPTTISQATTTSIPFYFELDGFPVQYNNQPHRPSVVWVNSQNEVTKASVTPFNLTPSPLTTAATIPISQLNTSLNNPQTLITSLVTNEGVVDNASINTLSVQLIEVEYRYDSTTNLITPFYRLVGVAKLINNEFVEVEIITPAVVTQP